MINGKKIFVFSIICLIIIGVIFYFFIYTAGTTINTAKEVRGGILDLAVHLDPEVSLDDYNSLLEANSTYRYNNCTGEGELINEPSWSRDWIYVILGDYLYSDIKNDTNLRSDSERILKALYNDYSLEDSDRGVKLDKTALHGQDSYCIPYLMISDLKQNSNDFKYLDTYNMAKQTCFDFYSTGVQAEEYYAEACSEEDNCLTDSELYESIDGVLELIKDSGASFESPHPIFLPQIDALIDEYIVAYEEGNENHINSLNKLLAYSIEAFVLDLMNSKKMDTVYWNDFDINYLVKLSKVLSVKGMYLDDTSLSQKNDNALRDLVTHFYNINDFKEHVFSDNKLSQRIQSSYILYNFLDDIDKNHNVEEFLEDDGYTHRYKGKKYVFLFSRKHLDDECIDFSVDLPEEAKNYFYLLLNTIND